MAKIATTWKINPSSVSTDTYEPSGVTYNTIFAAYDGNQSTTASPITTKVATTWSAT